MFISLRPIHEVLDGMARAVIISKWLRSSAYKYIHRYMLSSKRACLTSSFECEPILKEGSRPVQHLEDVVTSDSDDSISLEETGPLEALLVNEGS